MDRERVLGPGKMKQLVDAMRRSWMRVVITSALVALAAYNCWGAYRKPQWPSEQLHLQQAAALLRGELALNVADGDTIFYHGRTYAHYNLTPALIYLPLVAVTGVHVAAAYFVCWLFTCLNAVNLNAICRRLALAETDRWWMFLAFFFGTGYWFCLVYSYSASYNSHLFVCTFFLIAIREALGRARGWVLGLWLSALVTTRPLTLLAAPFFVVAMWNANRGHTSRTRFIGQFSAMAAAASPLVLALLLFNYFRFNSPWETGYSHIWYPPEYGLVSVAYLPRNLYFMFLRGFTLVLRGEYGVNGVEAPTYGTSLLHASPFLLLAFYVPARSLQIVSAWIFIALSTMLMCMFSGVGYLQYNCMRYAFDFLPVLFFLVVLGYRAQAIEGRTRLWKGLIIWSVGLNVITIGLLPVIDRMLGALADYCAR